MVMAEKSFPVQLMDDVRELFRKESREPETTQPGSELPAPGKCGCHPGGMHPMDEPIDVEQRNDVELVAIPVKVENIISVRTLPAKRASMETFYPGDTPATAVMIQAKDPRIKRLIIVVANDACWFGSQEDINANASNNSTTGGAGLFLGSSSQAMPAWEGISDDLWAMALNPGAVVSVRREYWPDI